MIVKAKPEHEVAYGELVKLLDRFAAQISPLELLAIAANLTGKLVALQDRQSVTPEAAMRLVIDNIWRGNHQAISEMNAGNLTGRMN